MPLSQELFGVEIRDQACEVEWRERRCDPRSRVHLAWMNLSVGVSSKASALEKEVNANPWNLRAWNSLLLEVISNPSVDYSTAKRVFELSLKTFPTFVTLHLNLTF